MPLKLINVSTFTNSSPTFTISKFLKLLYAHIFMLTYLCQLYLNIKSHIPEKSQLAHQYIPPL